MAEKREQGSVTVELAASIPLLVFLLLLLAQTNVVLLDQLAVVQASREAARVAAVDPSKGAAAKAARTSTRLDPHRLSVDVGSRSSFDGLVHVTVSYRSRVVVPFANRVLFEPTVTGTAAMAVEE